ncbi:MAG TPA: C1 family peptidase [Cyclobacteriaceae bacterium]|nr:C1 family peptidase [Cyclobacteriaceae bacterium]
MAKYKYGWRPSKPDHRDLLYSAPLHITKNLPKSVDLRSKCPPVYDQGALGSCTANGIAGALEFDQMLQGEKPFVPSRLFIYYNERDMEGSVDYDSGAEVRDGIKSVARQGACDEVEWPYDINKFTMKPSAKCYTDAVNHKAISYAKVTQSAAQLKSCLASGYPVVFGFTVYESFESEEVAQTGNAPMPGTDESILGGHCVVAVGYDDASQRFICRNSWGTSWGIQGYFTLPYAYILSSDLASDFWTIRKVQ